ncbi:hypothetical protein Tdes44962_MAKER04041 [Teratosphaeria destructans]|uniref:Uncharacterized protein n=1 Tax=Teratosphaeria destructans TaxID=418781 RepID=A0A9W7SNC7_9PEZI|nr:hypothetical protein Tdes44962_MAKER04041 [Teratosphaeria destructans]
MAFGIGRRLVRKERAAGQARHVEAGQWKEAVASTVCTEAKRTSELGVADGDVPTSRTHGTVRRSEWWNGMGW